ncbi:MAG: SDR family oxidoreductase [Proteobacteria bacterium]|nr:SDR family oxidoreductase [Pseudomonadota bacterium]
MLSFANKHVMITGAGGGIGRALVRRFSEAGARISAIDRDPALLAELAVAARAVFELTDGAAVRRETARLIEEQGAPDVVISNAGFTRAETYADVDDATFTREIEINLTGAYRVIDTALPAMASNGGGAIVAVSSVNGLAYFGNPAYSVAKAGLISYIEAVAVEWGGRNIRANTICPGSVMTPAWDHRFARSAEMRQDVLAHYPLNRLVTADDVAAAVAFLASPLAAGITGVALPVDAGLMAGNLNFVRKILGGAMPPEAPARTAAS